MTDSELKAQLDRMERKIMHNGNESLLLLVVIAIALSVILGITLSDHLGHKHQPSSTQQ